MLLKTILQDTMLQSIELDVIDLDVAGDIVFQERSLPFLKINQHDVISLNSASCDTVGNKMVGAPETNQQNSVEDIPKSSFEFSDIIKSTFGSSPDLEEILNFLFQNNNNNAMFCSTKISDIEVTEDSTKIDEYIYLIT